MARKTSAKPAPTTFDVTHTLAAAKPATCGDAHTVLVTAYGDEVADRFASANCKRLPRHSVTEAKGHIADRKPNGLMTAKQREAYKASRAAKPKASAKVVKPTTVVIDGITYRVGPKVRPAVA